MELLDILKRESEVTSTVYLYEESGHWCAYERSAYLLSKLLKGTVTVKTLIYDAFLVLNMVELDLDFDLLKELSITSCSDTELIVDFLESSPLKKVA